MCGVWRVLVLQFEPADQRLTDVQLNDIWEFHVDNRFAEAFLNHIDLSESGSATCLSQLCGKCQGLEISAPHFDIVDGWEDLEQSANTCDFCRMRWSICSPLNREDFPFIRFERDQSMLKLSGRYPPVLSLWRRPGKSHDIE